MTGRVKMLEFCLKRPTGNGRVLVLVTPRFSQFSGLTKSNYQTDALTAGITFFKFWTYKFE
jgi:hypothetical protein